MKIKKIREEKKITQEQMSKKLGITLRYYQNIEYGKSKPNIYIGLKIAKILEVDPFELYNLH